MAEQRENRTERASERRKREAREKGQVAISREVPTAAILLAGLTLLYLFIGGSLVNLVDFTRAWLARAVGPTAMMSHIGPDAFRALMLEFGSNVVYVVSPLLLGLMAVGVGSYLVQTGWIWKGVKVDPSRINPIKGLGRLFSLRSLVELIKSVLKVVIIVLVGYAAVRHDLPLLPALVAYDLWTVLVTIGSLMTKAALWIGVTIGLIAIADYAYQRFEWERSLRMTKDEVKQEHKETEGDPLLRSRVRSLQREMSRNRMMANVPKADVVITNPYHLAVALRYEPGTMGAPVVVAKGAGYVAERIKQIAAEHGITVVENQFVARSLYRLVDVGREIPANLYRAVAEILALVYKAKGQHTIER